MTLWWHQVNDFTTFLWFMIHSMNWPTTSYRLNSHKKVLRMIIMGLILTLIWLFSQAMNHLINLKLAPSSGGKISVSTWGVCCFVDVIDNFLIVPKVDTRMTYRVFIERVIGPSTSFHNRTLQIVVHQRATSENRSHVFNMKSSEQARHRIQPIVSTTFILFYSSL